MIKKIYKNSVSIYKVILFLVSTIGIVYLFPKGGKFKYDYSQGKPWLYENLYAPFDFAIHKTEQEISDEKQQIVQQAKLYFLISENVEKEVKEAFEVKLNLLNLDRNEEETDEEKDIEKTIEHYLLIGNEIIAKVYKDGFVDDKGLSKVADKETIVVLRRGNTVKEIPFLKMLTTNKIIPLVKEDVSVVEDEEIRTSLLSILLEILQPNVSYDKEFTEKELKEALKGILLTKGRVAENELIILKGDIVEGKTFNVLESFKNASLSQTWSETNYYWIVFGYTLLVSLALLMLLLFIKQYRPSVYGVNNKLTFIFFNVFMMFLAQTLVIKYNSDYLYVVPMIMLPIVIKAFFDSRLALFTYLLTILLLGFIVPDSFEYIYLHIIAGIITILTVSELYKRANLFISIGKITLIYMLAYVAFSIIKEGNVYGIERKYFMMFLANGLLSFLAVFFIYFYEKLFGLVSDVTLLELSNTNSELLRELNDKAPGTFQHSIQVANLAEACANEIGANSMLVRTGALYHDIGKMESPQFFIENQSTGVNPHNDLPPKDSASIIIGHVIKGIEIAKKNNLPDSIIDFIRTHHGTSLVYYFYKQEMDNNPDIEIDISEFTYPGPIPYSKETAILMMCDASEAASKSLKNPTAQSIDNLIDKIFEKQKSDNQFINSNITFREIEKIKKVIKNKLMNIYHLRIEYPE